MEKIASSNGKTDLQSLQSGYVSRLLVLLLYIVIGLGAVLLYLNKLNMDLVESVTKESASHYVKLLAEFRTLYTSEVVNTAREAGLNISHDYHSKDKSIPLPATLSMLLIEKLEDKGTNVKANLFSPYPFPWRNNNKSLDTFEKSAWVSLNANPQQPVSSVEIVDGVLSMRYAVADIMRPQCVNCHNTHPDTPKSDWKAGDVRGVLEVIEPLDTGFSKVRQIFLQMVLLISALLLLASFAAVVILRHLKRRHVELHELNGQLHEEMEKKQSAINALHEAQKHEELAKDEAIHAKEQALIAKDEAVAANKAKSQFLANISHEIRTPMNAILGYNQILQRDTSLNKDQENSLSIIGRSGEHLLGLINDVLDISKIEANVIEVSNDEFDLQELCHTLSDMFELKAKQKELDWRIVNEFALPSLIVKGDSGKLRQILINLIGNAIKFTESGYVQFSVTPVKDNLFRFCVIDSGPGIDQAHHKTIFDAFNQGERASQAGGTGLGLAISRRYLTLMGSEIHIESKIDEGAKFYFDLELEVLEEQPSEIENRQVSKLKEGQNVTILVLDDIAINRHLLCRMLNDIGFKTFSAETGYQAIKIMRENKIDLIFSDMMMPVMSGEEFLQKLREFNTETKVVAFSASSLQVDVSYYEQKGFDSYLSKPFRFEDVYDLIKELVNVEYEYRTETKKDQHQADLDTWRTLCAENQGRIGKLIDYCQLYQITEIEEQFAQWLAEDPRAEGLVSAMKPYVHNYDLDGLVEFLEGLKHG